MMGPMQMKGFAIARMERDGITLTRGIEVKDGEMLSGLRVFVSYGTATLRGEVKLENGTLPEGARIFVRLLKSSEQLVNSTYPSTVDARGHFLIEGITAGVYELTVSVTGLPNSQRPLLTKREVVMQDGMVNDITVTVDMSAVPKP